MSATIQLNSRQLLPLKEAATAVSYSRDYVARLAREEKITAVLINRQWMIDVGSLKNFSELSQLESEVKKNHLREIRKHELAVRQEYAERLNTLQTKITSKNNTTLVHSLLVILFGIGTGLLLNFTNIYLPPGRLEVTAQLPQKTVANFLPSFISFLPLLSPFISFFPSFIAFLYCLSSFLPLFPSFVSFVCFLPLFPSFPSFRSYRK